MYYNKTKLNQKNKLNHYFTGVFFAILFFGIFGMAGSSLAAPSISLVSGSVTHGQNITVNGVDFGVKSPAAPLMWDDGEGTHTLSDKYSGYAPIVSDGYGGDSNFNLTYHSGVFRSMSNPHSHGSRYISGGHDPDGADTHGYDAVRGANVGMVIPYNVQPFQKVYLTYYHALDPLWSTEGVHVTLDGANYNNNHKEINYQAHDALGVYDGNANYYGFSSGTSNDGGAFYGMPWSPINNPDYIGMYNNNTSSANLTSCLDDTNYCINRSEIVGDWVRLEDVADFSNQDETFRVIDGVKNYVNARAFETVDASFRTGRENILVGGYGCFQDMPVTIAIGSFTGPDGNGEYYATLSEDKRNLDKGHTVYLTKGVVGALAAGQWGYSDGQAYVKDNPAGLRYYAMNNACGEAWSGSGEGSFQHGGELNAYRYYDDIYADTTWSRIVLANNQDFDLATIVEPQIPSAWADDSLNATVNLGKLPDTGTAYLFVFDADNNHNATGYPVTLGGSGDTTPPSAPSGLSVL